ncbi:MAG TPA: gamma-glutamylcyclotransferase family protein [Terriglobales bacterium]|nr:gamma-glutamylcyclotransferase family protein [Terriglobales bacterium]
MLEPEMWTFFYGSYMNFDVLSEVQYMPENWEASRLPGFQILIRPRANLVRSDQQSIYGILATGTHAELGRLYVHARDVLGETYLPEAVLTETDDGKFRLALCYICPEMTPRAANNDYVDRIVVSARKYGFLSWYIQHLESFCP